MPEEKSFAGKRAMMYVIGFVFNLSYAIPTYVNSSFLSKTFSDAGISGGDTIVGVIYAAGSIAAIATFIEAPRILKRFGNFRVTMALIVANLVSLIGLIAGDSPLVVAFSFMLNFVTIALVNYTIDMFLEHYSSNSSTGKIRGTFLTLTNSAWLASPLLSSFLLGEANYGNVYMVSAALLVPTAGLLFFSMRKFSDPTYARIPFWKSVGEIWANKDMKGVLLSQFFLQFFYAWMVIYMPIYLHETIGFSWTAIGLIFTVMLVPFVLIEAPLGRIADSKLGEKEILSMGFVIMAVCCLLVPFMTDHSVVAWAALLFMSRVGAAMVEVMADTYFFKQVNASNAHLISFARMMRPLAYIISPILATILFIAFNIHALFIFLGILMVYALRYSMTLVDTK
jgi:MFS family permease